MLKIKTRFPFPYFMVHNLVYIRYYNCESYIAHKDQIASVDNFLVFHMAMSHKHWYYSFFYGTITIASCQLHSARTQNIWDCYYEMLTTKMLSGDKQTTARTEALCPAYSTTDFITLLIPPHFLLRWPLAHLEIGHPASVWCSPSSFSWRHGCCFHSLSLRLPAWTTGT